MKIVTWSIVNNEIDYIADIIEHHLPWVDTMYFLDTGSTDGTLELLREQSANPKIILEEYHTKFVTEYELPWEEMKNPFPEVDVRNYAIGRCKEICQPDWLIQLDGDEIFLPETRTVIELNQKAVAINHSTINPACELKTHRKEYRFGHTFYDPHSRIWNGKYAIMYMENNKLGSKQIHCNPTLKGWGKHLFEIPGTIWVKNNLHIHLHWLYGKKMESFFNRIGIFDRAVIKEKMPVNEFSKLLPIKFMQNRKKW